MPLWGATTADFEDFEVGSTITTMRRTIAEADMLAFVQLTGLFEELWLDASKASAIGLGTGRLVPGYLTLSFAEGLFVLTGWMRGAVGMLGVTDIKWLAPVTCGDTILCEVEIIEARTSKNPARGVVRAQHRVLNQNGVTVLSYTSARLIKTAGSSRGSLS